MLKAYRLDCHKRWGRHWLDVAGVVAFLVSDAAAYVAGCTIPIDFGAANVIGGIVGNVVIEASDVEAAKTKLMKRYPGCSILSVMEK